MGDIEEEAPDSPSPVEWTNTIKELIELVRRLSRDCGSDDKRPLSDIIPSNFFVNQGELLEFCLNIYDRVRGAAVIISGLDLDGDIRHALELYLRQLGTFFEYGQPHLACELHEWVHDPHFLTLRMISTQLPSEYDVPLLTPRQQSEIKELIETLLTWLGEHELMERDFIRQALIAGLRRFKWRLQHADLLGWSYAVDGLRDVVTAYMGLEQMAVGKGAEAGDPLAEAIVMKAGAMLKSLLDKLHIAKQRTESGMFGLVLFSSVYGGARVAHDTIAGLLK